MNRRSDFPIASTGRRSFISKGLAAASLFGATGMVRADSNPHSGQLTKGDAAILRFLAAAEILETDFWVQYNELGGIQDSEVPGGTGESDLYSEAASSRWGHAAVHPRQHRGRVYTRDFHQCLFTSKGASAVSLEQFRILQGSTATGSSGKSRLTNLMQLTLDTSWWTRYRSPNNNPDLDPNFVFPRAVPGLNKGQFPAIPRTNADLTPDDHIQAIANTAGFHMPTIEQGGNSLYPSLAQRVSRWRSCAFS